MFWWISFWQINSLREIVQEKNSRWENSLRINAVNPEVVEKYKNHLDSYPNPKIGYHPIVLDQKIETILAMRT